MSREQNMMHRKLRGALTALPLIAAALPLHAEVVTLDQGWDEKARDTFYHLPQGSPIMPYDWFLHLEQPEAEGLFRDEEHLEAFGMIPWGKSHLNPDGLPIGLTIDRGLTSSEDKLGMNCSACHVTEIEVSEKRVLIDGGVSHFDFWSFMSDLLSALQITYNDDAKFARFADRVLGEDHSEAEAEQLRARLRGVVRKREDWAFRNATNVEPGPGRVDALNVILNQVTAGMLQRPDNARPADAPVSYPYLWDAPYLDVVQYNGVVPNEGAGAIGRNVGQVLGVFGEVSVAEHALPPGYASSVRIDHLMELEETMETLTSPSWDEMAEKGLLPPLNERLVSGGKEIYAQECADCHAVIDRTDRGDLASIEVPTIGIKEVGTDPAAAYDFSAREVASGPLKGRKSAYVEGDPLCNRAHANDVLAHVTVGVMLNDLGSTAGPVVKQLGGQVKEGLLSKGRDLMHSMGEHLGIVPAAEKKDLESDEHLIARMAADGASEEEITAALEARSEDQEKLYKLLVEDSLNRDASDVPCLAKEQTAQYRARPLNGIWATGPYLHNGSVRTLEELLKPEEERAKSFWMGNSSFDPKAVGFVDEEVPGAIALDTSIPGNGNLGHEYGVDLDDWDRKALLEYLKSL
jgi:hypothetical protein